MAWAQNRKAGAGAGAIIIFIINVVVIVIINIILSQLLIFHLRIPLPTHIRRYTLLKAPSVYKKHRVQV